VWLQRGDAVWQLATQQLGAEGESDACAWLHWFTAEFQLAIPEFPRVRMIISSLAAQHHFVSRWPLLTKPLSGQE
jgi:hypothetical protein